MKRLLPLLVLLGGCGSNDPAPPPPSGTSWYFQYSPGMLVPNPYGNGAFSFSFPAVDGVHYLVKPHSGPLSQSISMTYSIAASPDAVFDYRTNPDNTCGPGFPGTVTAYFHMASDSAMQNEFGRWFYTDRQELKTGSFVLAAPFYSDPGKWVSVYGKNGKDFLPQLQAALANVAEVGARIRRGLFCRPRGVRTHGNCGDGSNKFRGKLVRVFIFLGQFGTIFSYGMYGLAKQIRDLGVETSIHGWRDVQEVINEVGKLHPDIPVALIGFSLGGNSCTQVAHFVHYPIELVVAYDPSELGTIWPLENNVKKAICYTSVNYVLPYGHGKLVGPVPISTYPTTDNHLAVCYDQSLHDITLAAIKREL